MIPTQIASLINKPILLLTEYEQMLPRLDECVLPENKRFITSRCALDSVTKSLTLPLCPGRRHENWGFEAVDAQTDNNRA